MTLAVGTRLGPYEVIAPLGAGGMGEVYRARDTRLGRTVAVKLLPRDLSADAERLERFEREARAASALSHPAIVAVHDVGKGEAGPWIAMELVEGSSLRELLAAGPMPIKKLLAAAATVADGLARAHEAGIVHRDLKPENVMITRDGHPKILDFGLAKMTEPAAAGQSSAPTRTSGGSPTGTGNVLGTVGYMSPEQAAGKSVDFRSDQFSFGAMLYEMVSGRRPFQRDSPAETLTAIIREEPEPLSPSCPPALAWIIERCLFKDREDRYAATRDLAKDLARLRDGLSDRGADLGSAPARSRARVLAPWLLAAALAAALIVTLSRARERRDPRRPARFSLEVPAGTTFFSGEISTNIAVAPDGRSVVLRVWQGNRYRLVRRRFDAPDAEPIEGTERAVSPFWSPDSRFVAFFADGKLKRVPSEGGPVATLCEARPEGPGSWSARGTILFPQVLADETGIYQVSDSGGTPQRVTRPTLPDLHLWPSWIDEGSRFLYLSRTAAKGHELRGWSIEKGDLGPVTGGSVLSRFEPAAPDDLLFVQEGKLLAQRFNFESLRLEGEPLVLAEGLHYFWGPGNAGFSSSRTGIVAWEVNRPKSQIAVLDRKGQQAGPVGEITEGIFSLRLSPDGSLLAYDLRDPRFGTWDVWVRDLERGIATRLTSRPDDEKKPVWFPDGRRLLWRADYEGPPDLHEIGAGGGEIRPVWKGPRVESPEDVSPDGKWALVTQASRKSGLDVLLLPLEGEPLPQPLFQSRFNEQNPAFSPDGRWIAWDSDESGQSEIYAVLRADLATRVRLSPGGGRIPRWSRDGREIFYLEGRRIMAVPLTKAEKLHPGAAMELFRVDRRVIDYDVSPDGNRFYLALEESEPGESRIRILLDWPALRAAAR